MADLSSLSDDALLSALGPAPAAAHTPAAFVAQHQGTAQAAAQQLGVDPNLLLAQWGLETGWGKSVVPGTNNLGNIKDFSGGGVAARDNMTGSTDNYRQYASPEAFAADQASLLQRKYPGVVGAGGDVQKFAGALQGYAQDPAYAQKLAGVLQTVQRSQPGFLARAGNAVASAISGTANAATPHDLSGISDDDLLAALNSRQPAAGAVPSTAGAAKPSNSPPLLDLLGHQLGLTARAVGHGIADAAGLIGNPINATINLAGRAIGHDPHLQDVDTLIRQGVDAVTPAYANDTERTVGGITDAVANPVNAIGGELMAGANTVRQAIVRGAVAGGATAGMQPMHEGDTLGTEAQRVAAGSVGGALGGAAGSVASNVSDKLINGVNSVVTAIKANLPSTQAAAKFSADDILRQAAQQQGIDLSAIPQSILNGVRGQVADALANNRTLDPRALLRNAEGTAVLGPENGLTLGQATRDPMQFARERNLRGVDGAGAPLTERFANQNRGLIDSLNTQGATAAPGEFNAGQSTIAALQARDAAQQANISQLYQKARDLNGGDIPLDHRAFVDEAYGGLDNQLKMAFLPDKYKSILDDISSGKTPLTVGVAEQLKTMLGASQRAASDGNERFALGMVRDALDRAPPLQGTTQFGGNQLVPAGADLPASNLSEQTIGAFNAARAAARARFGEIDANPALRAVVNGDAVPDNFFKKNVLNGTVGDVNSLLALVPDQGAALRAQVVDHLKQRALNGASDEVGNFSQSAFNKALNSIGTAKLNALFPAEQVAQLQQIGRVAANIQAQPAGAAVNNSNTGAAVMNLLSQMGGKVGGLPGVNIARNSLNQFLDERKVAQALAARVQAQSNPGVSGSLNGLLPLASPAGTVAGQPGH